MTARRRGSMGDAIAKMQRLRGEPGAVTRRRITVYIRDGLYQQARAAILDLGAQGLEPASISALLDDALERELRRLAKKHRGGEPWPLHRGRLPGGRPPKA